MKIIKGCLGIALAFIALLLLLLLTLALNFRAGWFDQSTTKPVLSPDGNYAAYVGVRGMLDSVRGRLYIKKGDEPAKRVVDLYKWSDIKWSPDSQRVAILDEASKLHLFDVKTNKKCTADVEMASSRPMRRVDWEWAGPNTIGFAAVRDGQSGDTITESLVKYDVVNDSGCLKLVMRKTKTSP